MFVAGAMMRAAQKDRQSIEDLKRAHFALREEIAGDYVKKAELNSMHLMLRQDIKEMLEQLRDEMRELNRK